MLEMDKGPQTSQWIRLKGTDEVLLWIGNGKRFCLAIGHTLQWSKWSLALQEFVLKEIQSLRNLKVVKEGWSSL